MAVAQIKAGEYPLGKIFGTDFVFRIPRYQRPYSWEAEHAEELLDDLLAASETGGDPDPYFLGSIVVIKRDNLTEPDAEVVDGQQRLTTLTILLSALRAVLGGTLARELTPYIYEKGITLTNTPDRFRLSLRDDDNAFFRDYVQVEGALERLRALDPKGLPEAQKHIRDNALLFMDRLLKLPETRRETLAGYLVTKCSLIVVSTQDFDSGYRVFTVLNSRGAALTTADILKSEIIGNLPPGDRERYGKEWELLERRVGRGQFGELISHARTIYMKAKAKKSILAEFRSAVSGPVGDSRKLLDDVLFPFARAFDSIKSANYQSTHHAEDINRLLKWLGRVDNTDWLPPAILFMDRHKNDAGTLLPFFRDLERLAAGMMTNRANVNARILRYAEVVKEIEKSADANLYAPNSPLQLTADEQADAVKAIDGDVYKLPPKLRTYIMLRLDAAVSDGGVTHDDKLVSVEHVLPQNPKGDSEWVKWFPEKADRAAVVHRLGNLALLTRRKNSSVGSLEFTTKKKKYFQTKKGVTKFALTTQIVNQSEWTPEVIARRQIELVGVLRKLWRLDEAA